MAMAYVELSHNKRRARMHSISAGIYRDTVARRGELRELAGFVHVKGEIF